MSLTKFTENVNNVSSLPNKPNIQADDLKRVFDQAGNSIKEYLNNILTDEVDKIESNLKKMIQTNAKAIDDNKKEVYDMVYPVGSIYMSVNSASPESLFGGTWEKFAEGRTLIGVTSSDTDFNIPEKTGGEKTHKLTIDEIPSHNHLFTGKSHSHGVGSLATNTTGDHNHTPNASGLGFQGYKSGGAARNRVAKGSDYYVISSSNQNDIAYATGTSTTGDHKHTLSGNTATVTQGGTISNTGSGNSFNITQSYVTCYIWKRIS